MARLGEWITTASLVLVALCVAPMLLYMIFGPSDGNPIGLGLLMVFGGPLFFVTAILGRLIQVWALRAGDANDRED